jgi:hypothetical protein
VGAAIEGAVSGDALKDGAFMTLGPGCSLFAQTYADQRHIWAVTFQCEENESHHARESESSFSAATFCFIASSPRCSR